MKSNYTKNHQFLKFDQKCDISGSKVFKQHNEVIFGQKMLKNCLNYIKAIYWENVLVILEQQRECFEGRKLN